MCNRNDMSDYRDQELVDVVTGEVKAGHEPCRYGSTRQSVQKVSLRGK